MKLKEFLDNLNRLAEVQPEALELEVITSMDDEGNGYNPVYYSPTMGNFDGCDFSQINEDEQGPEDANAICVN
jgi:hypothetical protein